MENLVLETLPLRKYPSFVCYGVTILLVAATFLVRYALEGTLGSYPFLLFSPGVFFAALMFGRGPGFCATGLSAVVATYFIEPVGQFWITKSNDIVALVIFVLSGGGITLLTAALRTALERLDASGREKDLLLREVNHRIANDFQNLLTLLMLEQQRVVSPDGQESLTKINEHLRVLAQVYQSLIRHNNHATVRTAAFLNNLAQRLRQTQFSGRPVDLNVKAVDAKVSLDCAVSIGLIVNELITNAAKYAFPGNRKGQIQVVFTRDGDQYRLTVADNGIGSTPASPKQGTGLGLEMVWAMAKQLGGNFEMTAGKGLTATTRFPVVDCCFEEEARTYGSFRKRKAA